MLQRNWNKEAASQPNGQESKGDKSKIEREKTQHYRCSDTVRRQSEMFEITLLFPVYESATWSIEKRHRRDERDNLLSAWLTRR